MSQNLNANLKAWEQRNKEEREASIGSYHTAIIGSACKHGKEFWKQDRTKEEIDKNMPYNAKTGEPYYGIPSILLQCIAELKGYEDKQFLSMKQANTLGGKLRPLKDENGNEVINEKTGKRQFEGGLKILLRRDYELVPKLDDYKLPITKAYTNKDGVEERQPVMEKQFLKEPIYETVTIYHVSQFDDLDKSKFAEKNMENVNQKREKFRNTEEEPQVAKQLNKLNLHPNTRKGIEAYLNAQNKGLDYQAPFIQKEKTQAQTQEQSQNKSQEAKHTKAKKASVSMER